MTVCGKIKIINIKIEQNKAQYNLDRQAPKISALLLVNVGKYEFLIGPDVLSKKDLLGKAARIKRYEYLPLGSELKKQTDIAKNNIKNLTRLMNLTKRKRIKQNILIKRKKLKQKYSTKFTFYKCHDIKTFFDRSFVSN